MTADLGLVMHAAEADADEFAPRGARDALAERGLADAGRPDEAQDRAAAVRIELADREEFENAPLDLVAARNDPRRGSCGPRRCRSAARLRPSTAARSAIRDRCAPSSIRRPPRACVRAAPPPFWRAPRPLPACRPCRSSRAARRFPGSWRRRPRPVPSGSSSAARAAGTRAGGRRCVSLVRSWIWRDSRSTSSRYDSSSEMRSSRRSIAMVSRISCFSAEVMSMKLAIRSASAGAVVTPWTALTSSAGVCGSNCSTSSAWLRRCNSRASISVFCSSDSARRSTRATKKG